MQQGILPQSCLHINCIALLFAGPTPAQIQGMVAASALKERLHNKISDKEALRAVAKRVRSASSSASSSSSDASDGSVSEAGDDEASPPRTRSHSKIGKSNLG